MVFTGKSMKGNVFAADEGMNTRKEFNFEFPIYNKFLLPNLNTNRRKGAGH